MEKIEYVHKTLRGNSLTCAGLPTTRLPDALAMVKSAYCSGVMGSEYRDSSLEDLLSVVPPDWAASVWVVAVPSPLLKYRFMFETGEASILLPAMYLYSEPMRRAEGAMRAAHGELGERAEWAWLPVRILAAAAGLGEFGRNNMLYLPDQGSFPWLTGFFSSLAVPDIWREAARMTRCENCAACVKACPSQALSRENRLMRSDRCLNYVTEYLERGSDWFTPRMQRELLGCLTCQLACPANREHRDWIEDGPSLSREETEELLAFEPRRGVSRRLLDKLGGDDIKPYVGVMARQLAAY